MLNKQVYEKYIEKAQLHPGVKYAPCKPLYTFHNFEDLWKNWASKHINNGKVLEVEKKCTGQHYVLQYNGNDIIIYSNNSKIDKSKQFPQIGEDLKKIGPVILNVIVEDTNKVWVYDCVYYKGQDLTDLPLSKRRAYLKELVMSTTFLIPTAYLVTSRDELEKHVDKILYEDLSNGVVIKVWKSTFKFESDSNWVKLDRESQEYFITCTPYYKIDRIQKKVVRRGSRWCVVHAHPKKPGSTTDRAPGTPIKCFTGPNAKQRAIKMHQAILISQAKEAGKFKHIEKMQTEPEMSPEIKAPTQMIGHKPQKKIRFKIRIKKPIKKYGTSEGAIRAWDTRGRGRKTQEQQKIPKGRSDVAIYTDADGKEIILTVDHAKLKEYVNTVQTIKDLTDTIVERGHSPDVLPLQQEVLRLDKLRSELHNSIVEEGVKQVIEENPTLPKKEIESKMRGAVSREADRVITHARTRELGKQ